jgi:hypothetical protein
MFLPRPSARCLSIFSPKSRHSSAILHATTYADCVMPPRVEKPVKCPLLLKVSIVGLGITSYVL